MAKFTVRCYYTYCGIVEVEANSIEDAARIGNVKCEDMTSAELEYVGQTDIEVQDENGEIYQL